MKGKLREWGFVAGIGLAGLISGCAEEINTAEVIEQKIPTQIMYVKQDNHNLWAWDVNQDGQIDEVVRMNDMEIPLGNFVPAYVEHLLPSTQWSHLIASDIGPEVQYVHTDYTKPLPEKMRETLTRMSNVAAGLDHHYRD